MNESINIINGLIYDNAICYSNPIIVNEISGRVQSFSISASNFKGKVTIEASLHLFPNEDQWFTIKELEFPTNANATSQTSTVFFNYTGRYRILRTKIDRSYISNFNVREIKNYGIIDRLLLKM